MRGLFPDKDLARALACKVFGPPKPVPSSSSPANVSPSSTLGSMDTCWCGRARDHDFPGRDEGAPHPRYPD